MLNYEEIAEKYGFKMTTLTHTVSYLKIKGVFRGNKKYFTPEQVFDIVTYNPTDLRKKDNDRRKLKIVELYLKYGSGRKVAYMTNINRKFIMAAIKEYNETGYLTVDSKMNRIEQ